MHHLSKTPVWIYPEPDVPLLLLHHPVLVMLFKMLLLKMLGRPADTRWDERGWIWLLHAWLGGFHVGLVKVLLL